MDKVWGDCTAIKSQTAFRSGDERAFVNTTDAEDRFELDLCTRYDFGCVAWSSLRAAIKAKEEPHDH